MQSTTIREVLQPKESLYTCLATYSCRVFEKFKGLAAFAAGTWQPNWGWKRLTVTLVDSDRPLCA